MTPGGVQFSSEFFKPLFTIYKEIKRKHKKVNNEIVHTFLTIKKLRSDN